MKDLHFYRLNCDGAACNGEKLLLQIDDRDHYICANSSRTTEGTGPMTSWQPVHYNVNVQVPNPARRTIGEDECPQ